MDQEVNLNDDEGRIKVYITFQDKAVLFSVNPKNTLRITMDNMQKLANMYPDKFWNLPEMDDNGQRITYYLGKMDAKAIFNMKSDTGEEQSLEKFGVKPGDKLKIVRKVVAG
jgi:5'-3' exonuclease